jgi:hypothetical protein
LSFDLDVFMKPARISIFILILLVIGVYTSFAQECDLNIDEIVARVTEECAGIGENQVCYGNRNVVARQRINTVDFVFENPGDIINLSNVDSLFVSEIDPATNEWGVAQLRLQVSSEAGNQDMTMLLFGAFNIENAVANTPTLAVSVRTRSAVIYTAPDVTSLSLGDVTSGTVLQAVGRLEDSSWLHVENQATGRVGWIAENSVQPVNAASSIGILPVQTADDTYYGAMQAFYFSNGTSDIGCNNLASDGLLIQTPEGVARVSLLINEVSIELTGGGAGVSGTAFVQASPDSETGMQVNVVQGQAEVQAAGGETQTVNAGQQSVIPLDEDLQASGAPSEPIVIDLSNINIQPLMPTFNTTIPTTGSGSAGLGNGNGTNLNPSNTGSNTTSGGGNGVGNGTNITGSNGGSGSNSGGSNSSNTGTSGSISITTGNGSSAATPYIPSSLDEIERAQQAANNPSGLTQGNIIALTLAVIAAALIIGGIVFYTINSKKR